MNATRRNVLTQATALAHPNIALVKYWGKRDVERNLPAAGSLSMTLDGLATTTTVRFDPSLERDTMFLDGAPAAPKVLNKALRVVDPIRSLAGLETRAHIESTNDFPTGAGLASSASGLAALTVATAAAAAVDLAPAELSAVARVGSGSACRSIFGGFVQWQAGSAVDGSDSYARPLQPPEHWDLRVVVAVVAAETKTVDSTRGMLHCAETSPFHQAFLDTVDADLAAARTAVDLRDLAALGRVAERSSLRMHASMMAADPPLVYLRPETWQVVNAVRALQQQGAPVFFTADAGPNVKVFCEPSAVDAVHHAIESLGVARRLIDARPGGGARVLPVGDGSGGDGVGP